MIHHRPPEKLDAQTVDMRSKAARTVHRRGGVVTRSVEMRRESHRGSVMICQRAASLASKCPAMKKTAAAVGLAMLVVTVGCLEQAGGTRSYKGPLFHYHFAGRANLPAGTNATRFKEIDAL